MQALPRITSEDLSAMIGAIYDCVIEPGRWPATLAQLREALVFHNAVMNVMSLSSGQSFLDVVSGVEPPFLERMRMAGAEVVEQWGGAERIRAHPLDEPAVLSWVNPRANWQDNRYYVEWARPQGIIDVMAVGLTRHGDLMGTIGFGRHETAGEIGPRETDAARLLIPHLQRAVAIGKLLDLKTVTAQTHQATLDAVQVAIVLVDAGLGIVHANRAAHSMLTAGDLIRARGRQLEVTAALAAHALARAVRHASDDEATLGRRGFGIPASPASGRRCVLHVLPLGQGVARPNLAPCAVAAIFVVSAQIPAPTSHDVLATLFDLTLAEARVFSLIVAGRTPTEAARELRVAFSTVKTHLVHIFTKTGARRQADLVRLAASLSLPL